MIENYDYKQKPYKQIFNHPPKRVITTNGSATEMMLKLGLAKYLLGTAYLDNPILDELREEYSSIPVISKKYPIKEQVLYLEPDFIFGWHSVFDSTTLGDTHYWNSLGVGTYIVRNSLGALEKSFDNCYIDILNIGKIFNVSDRAEQLVAEIKQDLKLIENIVQNIKNKKTIAILSSEYQGQFRAYGSESLISKISEFAGGVNAFKKHGEYSLEALLAADPDVIIFVYMIQDGHDLERRINYIRQHPILKNLKAVKNNNLKSQPLAESYCVGIRLSKAIKHMALNIYPEFFGEHFGK